jgi:hypothetical protein
VIPDHSCSAVQQKDVKGKKRRVMEGMIGERQADDE